MEENKSDRHTKKKSEGWSRVNKCIGCDVKNCHYHDSSNYCTAEQINVGPVSAATSADTICATFKPKEE